MALSAFYTKANQNRIAFNSKYKLDYDYDYFKGICNDVLDEIFSYSDYIHSDVLFRMVKRIVSFEHKETWIHCEDMDDSEQEIGEEIMSCIMQEMESLYDIREDEIFYELVFEICNILYLDASNYGVTKVYNAVIQLDHSAKA